MVARRILVPPVRVRILPRQHKERAKSVDLALSCLSSFAPREGADTINPIGPLLKRQETIRVKFYVSSRNIGTWKSSLPNDFHQLVGTCLRHV